MFENILSLEDLKFLEVLHTKFDLQYLRVDESGLKINNEQQISRGSVNESFDNMSHLAEISKKLRFRLDSNFQLNFLPGFSFQVEKF
jgi:hypothetical protein